jgi:Metallo-peptidase family M12B Reprolysin-like
MRALPSSSRPLCVGISLALAVAGALLPSATASAAQGNYWLPRSGSSGIITDKAVARPSFPKAFKLFELSIAPLREALFSVADNRDQHATIISLPNPDGNIEEFEVVEASNFEPDLQARFPEIRAFSGRGITDPSASVKLSLSPQGIQSMVFRSAQESEFIEAFSADHVVYAVFRAQRQRGALPWVCSTEDRKLASEIGAQVSPTPDSSAGQLKTMRLAQSCNGEYANFFGATSSADVALVLAAFNATLTRCNGVFEKDLAVHLNLIASTTNVIYYNPATDPYTTLGAWNGQLQATLTANIGEANYDIGHMFGASGGGGNAGCIGCVCVDGSKGSGITSPADAIPMGDNFDIDYVIHEMGHQLGGNHTYSFQNEGPGPAQKEVGSGITIMGYAGITNQDVAPHSIDIFHEASIAQIQTNLVAKTCPITTAITANNATPVVAALSSFTIPISTPFALTGSATDADSDPMTYCWEQNDNTTTFGANSVASPTKATGPNWLSFSPTTSPTRLFPRLSTIQAGLFVTPTLPGGDAIANIEALSSISRTLNFRLTVRDNHPYSSTAPIAVGQTQFGDMTVTVTNTSGPFRVTAPNTVVSWAGLSSQTVTWAVAGTTGAPVSCANVKISLSTDGGVTFPAVLAASTANDGTEVVVIPDTPTSTARVKVECLGNIFFDMSDTNFAIAPSPVELLSFDIS